MNASGINYLISGGLLRDSGNFKIFYDFNSYSQSGTGYFVNSIPIANKNYSGQIYYFNQDINNGNFVDLTLDVSRDILVTKSGEFDILGHRISSTGYGNSYIKIINTGDLYNNSEFTFIFEGGKISRKDAKNIYNYTGFNKIEPFHNKEIIFSNITGNGINYSGWEFGLNSANLFYFRTSDDSKEKILTYYSDRPSSENIWAVSYNNKKISISRFIPETNEIYSVNTNLISDLKSSNNWHLGSGINSNLNYFDSGNANANTSSLKIKNFLYFSEYLSTNQILQVSKALTSDLQLISGTTFTGNTFLQSGYNSYYQVTGNIGTALVLSGYITGFVSTSGGPVYSPISGQITICDSYLQSLQQFSNTGASGEFISFQTGSLITGNQVFSINSTDYLTVYIDINESGSIPIYVQSNVLVTGTITPLSIIESQNINQLSCQTYNVITGLDITYYSTGYQYLTPVYIQSGITGIIDSGYYISYTGIPSGSVNIVEYSYEFGDSDYSNLLYESISYFGKRNEFDFIEINSGNKVYTSGIKNTNYNPIKSFSNFQEGYSLNIDTGIFDRKKYKFYLNGVALRSGDASIYKIIEDGLQKTKFNLTKDYFITGQEFIISDILFTGTDEIINLYGILDISKNDMSYQELLITGLDDYTSGIFSQISPSGKDIFFNGIKIYEDLQYVNINNNFAPIGLMTGITGLYFAWQKSSGINYYTGENYYNLYNTGNNFFERDSALIWINGARKNINEFVYHNIDLDLISGVYIYLENGYFVSKGNIKV